MIKKMKKSVFWIILAIVVAANLYFVAIANASIKETMCQGVGCPNGARPCADVTISTPVGSITAHCYEPAPAK